MDKNLNEAFEKLVKETFIKNLIFVLENNTYDIVKKLKDILGITVNEQNIKKLIEKKGE